MSYARHSLIATLALILSLVSVIFWTYPADPYRLFQQTGVGFDLFYHLRLHKPYAMSERRATHLLLGSSRSARLPTGHSGFGKATVYNASLPGATLRELRRVIEHAQAVQPLEAVLLGLDFYMFRSGHSKQTQHYEEDRLRRINPSALQSASHLRQQLQDYWQALFSIDALVDSLEMSAALNSSKRQYLDDGTWMLSDGANRPPAKKLYRMLITQKYQDFLDQHAQLDMTELRALVQFCLDNQIQLNLILSPMHALVMEAVSQAGGWRQYLAWQQQVVNTVESSGGEISVFGFEADSHLVTESMLAVDPMFLDGVHYSRRTGQLMLDCVLETCSDELRGERLHAENMQDYLDRVERLRDSYQRKKPSDYRWLLSVLALDSPTT